MLIFILAKSVNKQNLTMAIVVLPAFPRFSGEKCSAAESTTEMDGNMFSLVEIIRRLAVHPSNVI